MADRESRIAAKRAFDCGHCVSVTAEKTRDRLLELFERERVSGRRDQSNGVGQGGHGRGEAVIA